MSQRDIRPTSPDPDAARPLADRCPSRRVHRDGPASRRRAAPALFALATSILGCSDGTAPADAGAPSATAAAPLAPPSASSAAPASSSSASTPAGPPAPPGMAYIGGATFDAVMGDGSVARTEVRSFFIDQEKVTNGAFKKCYDDRTCLVSTAGSLDFLKPSLAAGPVTGMTLVEARAFCKSVGKRLPTTAEWQLAARGSEGRKYPWGNEEPAACSAPDCKAVRIKTPEGLIGMAGVLWEMSDADVCFVKAAKPELCTQKAAVLHGGAWNTSAESFASLAVHNASAVPPSTISFRCAKDAG